MMGKRVHQYDLVADPGALQQLRYVSEVEHI